MTDLAHTYTTDIQYQETQVDAADTQFDIQRMGQNCNYLIDNIAPVVAELNLLSTTLVRATPFNASGFHSGTGVIFTPGPGIIISMAIVLVQPGLSNQEIMAPTGMFAFMGTPGPSIPTFALIRNPGTETNWGYNFSGGQWKCYVEFPAHDSLYFATTTPGSYNIQGVAIHG